MAKSRFERFPVDEVDLDRPNVARVYDYYLGGTANYAVDRVFAEKALAAFPFVRPAAKANRLFLRRAVRHLCGLGVRQFVDIGSGVPTMGSTHQVADEVDASTRVVYVDNEPVAVAHAQMLLDKEGDPARHHVIRADLRDPDRVWRRAGECLDLDQPVALLLIAVLHVSQPGPDGADAGPAAVARFRELLGSGSYLVLSHGTADGVPEGRAREMAEFGRMYDATATPVTWRPRREIEALFGDLEMIEPGATWTPLWHPEEQGDAPAVDFTEPNDSVVWAGVGRKP